MKSLRRGELKKLVLFLALLPVAVNCRLMPFSGAKVSIWTNSIAMPVYSVSAATASEPELPRFYLNTTYVAPTKAPRVVNAGDDLQAAINAAQPGDVLTLQAGATFTGNFVFPAKSGADWIIIRTSTPDSAFPAPGTRVGPANAGLMPKIVTNNDLPAIATASGAHNYRFIGIEFTVGPLVTNNFNLIQLGNDETSLNDLPHDLIFDRVYAHGNPTVNLRRGIMMNSASTAVIDSYISDCHENGADSQALAGWNTPGPLKVVNNYLEAGSENFLLGGADPTILNLNPSDIEFQRNYCAKQLSWHEGEPNYTGVKWQVKNLLELKNAQRVLINGNLFEYNWAEAQSGFAILFTVRNQGGRAPWSVVQDVTFTNNIVRHSGSGVNISGYDDDFPSAQTARIKVRNNLFDDINGPRWSNADGRWLQIVGGPDDVTIDHNTSFQTGHVAIADGTPAAQQFVFTNNLAPSNAYGFFGSGVGSGNPALEFYFPGAVFTRNVIVGGDKTIYPADNFFPAGFDTVQFVDQANGNYRLASTSPYKNAGTDSKDLGCDIDAINSAIGGIGAIANVSAASYFSDSLAIDSIAAAFGSGLSSTTLPAPGTPLPTTLGGTSIKITDKFNVVWDCQLFYVSPTQINYLVPPVSAQGAAQVSVLNGGSVVASGTIQISAVAPGFFTVDASGGGLPTATVLRVRNGEEIYEPIVRFDTEQNKMVAVPIDLGSESDRVFLNLYGSGFKNRSALSNVVAKIGGIDSQVVYAGLQGFYAGLDQMNVLLPRDLIGRGDVDIDVTVDGKAANKVRVNIK